MLTQSGCAAKGVHIKLPLRFSAFGSLELLVRPASLSQSVLPPKLSPIFLDRFFGAEVLAGEDKGKRYNTRRNWMVNRG